MALTLPLGEAVVDVADVKVLVVVDVVIVVVVRDVVEHQRRDRFQHLRLRLHDRDGAVARHVAAEWPGFAAWSSLPEDASKEETQKTQRRCEI